MQSCFIQESLGNAQRESQILARHVYEITLGKFWATAQWRRPQADESVVRHMNVLANDVDAASTLQGHDVPITGSPDFAHRHDDHPHVLRASLVDHHQQHPIGVYTAAGELPVAVDRRALCLATEPPRRRGHRREERAGIGAEHFLETPLVELARHRTGRPRVVETHPARGGIGMGKRRKVA